MITAFTSRVRLGRRLVDADDPGVRHRRAEDGEVQHAGQFDVVAVFAEPAHEAGVLLAEHPTETARLVVVEVVVRRRHRIGGYRRVLGDRHDAPPAAVSAEIPTGGAADSRPLAAAHWIERTIVA